MSKHINCATVYESRGTKFPVCGFRPPHLDDEFVTTYRESDCATCRMLIERIKASIDVIMEVNK